MREVLRLDLDKLDLRAAVSGTIAVAIALVFVGIFGDVGLAAGIAALFVIAAGPEKTRGPDAVSFLFVLAGAIITLLVGYSASSVVAASVTVGIITLLATLSALWGRRFSTAGVFAVLWSIIVLTVGATSDDAAPMAIAFTLGGVIAIVAIWISSRLPSDEPVPSDEDAPETEPADGDEQGSPEPNTATAKPAVSLYMTFAVLRALIVGSSLYIGYQLFPDHPTWMVLTFVIIVRPPVNEAFITGVARALGTALGVLLGMLVAQITFDNTAAQLVAFVVCGFGMVAVSKVNYMLSTMFLTTFILLSEQFIVTGVITNGWQRLLATLMGVGVGFLLIWVMRVLTPSKPETAPNPAT